MMTSLIECILLGLHSEYCSYMYAHTQHEEERRRAEEKRMAAEARRKEELERREREVSVEDKRGRGSVSPLLLPLSSL